MNSTLIPFRDFLETYGPVRSSQMVGKLVLRGPESVSFRVGPEAAILETSTLSWKTCRIPEDCAKCCVEKEDVV